MLLRFHIDGLLVVIFFAALAVGEMTRWYLSRPGSRFAAKRTLAITSAIAVVTLFLSSYLFTLQPLLKKMPPSLGEWLGAAGLAAIVFVFSLFIAHLIWRATPRVEPRRRIFLKAAAAAVVAAPVAATAFGIVNRRNFHVNEQNIIIPGLAKDLDGLRIVQVTDIHLSPFLSERDLERVIDMANETRAHLGLITGDLITTFGDPLDACLHQIGRLRADAGVLGCLGNHEAYTKTENYVTAAGRRMGIDFLRQKNRVLRFGNASINFAGVDYQRFRHPYLIGAQRMLEPGMLNIMLSHNPDVFPVAAAQGYDFTIAGHTHGGQVNFEIFDQDINVARYFTHYVRGLYRQGAASIYVSTGVGTIGVPVRIGAPAEVAVLKLCAS